MLEAWLESAVGVVWNYPVVGLCLFAGIFFTLRMALIQLRCFPHALALVSGRYDKENEPGSITHFQALSAALSGTIGLGNIAGVAIAIAVGGPGSVFWMWIIAVFGMATKYAECALGTIYREKDPISGRFHGGPMHYIVKGLGPKWWPMAAFFAFCAMIGSFGFACMFQANQVSSAMSRYFAIPDYVTGLALSALVALTIIGGIKRIGSVAGKIVPAMCGLYLLAAAYVMITHIDLVPLAHSIILQDAFSGQAAAGGALGAVLIIGVRRAIFSNEAGMGSAPIAHATVKTNYPIREGIVASLGPLIDTIVVCTATAMIIIISGSYGSERYMTRYTAPMGPANVTEWRMDNGWRMQANNLPVEDDQLRELRQGEHALVFDGAGAGGVVQTPLIPTSGVNNSHDLKVGERLYYEGLRFSDYHTGTERRVQVLDSLGSLIGTLAINQTGDTVLGPNGETLLSISPSWKSNDWQSHVITFGSAFQRRIQEDPTRYGALRLGFSGSGSAESYWAVDRIQAVTGQTGIELTAASFDRFFGPIGGLLLTIAVFFFCYSTMVTWSYYGQTAATFLFGHGAVTPYRWAFVIACFIGAITKLTVVLNFSDLMSGLMVIPNTIAILLLSPVVVRETKDYFRRLRAGEFEPDKEAEHSERRIAS